MICTVSLLLIAGVCPLFADDSARLEVIVYFSPESIEFPLDRLEADISDVTIHKSSIAAVFQSHNIQEMRYAIPDLAHSPDLSNFNSRERPMVLALSNAYVVKAHSLDDVQPLIDELCSIDGVVLAEPNYLGLRACIIPNDPYFDEQWAMNDLIFKSDINAPGAWDITTGVDIKVAVLDNGVDAGHEDLLGKVSGYPGVYEGDADWPFGHGTHIAGIIGAIGNNGKGVAGVNWNARIYAQRVENATANDIFNCVKASMNAGSKIINCSFSKGDDEYCATLDYAFIWAYIHNVVTVAAMGNYGQDGLPRDATRYPAAFEQGIISVGATDMYGYVTNFSCIGPWIDVVAPGEIILSTMPYTDEYGEWGGTSMAAPFVSGLASLLLSVKPDLYNDDVEAIIRISANKYPNFDIYRGYGRIDAHKALQLLLSPYSLTWSTANGSGCTATLIYEDRDGPFQNIDGLIPNMYFADIYEVAKEVTYDKIYVTKPEVWGRGWPTTGYSLANPNFGVGYTGVSDVTKDGCRLITYVYDLYSDPQHVFIGRYPCEPSQVQYTYSVLGIEDLNPPEVTVVYANGGEYFRSGETMLIQWEVEDEYLEGVRCGVQYNINGGSGNWIVIAFNIPVDSEGHGECTYTVPCGIPRVEEKCRIQVIAIDTNQHQGLDISDNDFTIEYITKPGEVPIPNQGISSAPDKNFLSAPTPNPFNPYTLLQFGIKEPALVSLVVYDINGKPIKTFYRDSFINAGLYTQMWDGIADNGIRIASGVYFLKFRANDFTTTNKLVLLR